MSTTRLLPRPTTETRARDLLGSRRVRRSPEPRSLDIEGAHGEWWRVAWSPQWLGPGWAYACTCPSYTYRKQGDAPCKHILFVRMLHEILTEAEGAI